MAWDFHVESGPYEPQKARTIVSPAPIFWKSREFLARKWQNTCNRRELHYRSICVRQAGFLDRLASNIY